MIFFNRHASRFAGFAFSLAIAVAAIVPNEATEAQSGLIKIIDPFPAGGTADILARLLAEHIGTAHGQNLIVENRPGASASIGYELVSRAAPDGKTLIIGADSIVVNPLLKKTDYDPKDFAPICELATSPLVFVVDASSPYHSIGELISAARASPGKLTFGALGPATARVIQLEQFKKAANVDMIFVPFPGGAPVVNALLGHQVTVGLVNYSEAVSQLQAGTLRALATGSASRIPPLPNVPTIAESGFSGYKAEVWFGVFAPAKTADETTTKLAAWFTEALKAPGVQDKLQPLGLYGTASCGADFAKFVDTQYGEYGRIIRDANLNIE